MLVSPPPQNGGLFGQIPGRYLAFWGVDFENGVKMGKMECFERNLRAVSGKKRAKKGSWGHVRPPRKGPLFGARGPAKPAQMKEQRIPLPTSPSARSLGVEE